MSNSSDPLPLVFINTQSTSTQDLAQARSTIRKYAGKHIWNNRRQRSDKSSNRPALSVRTRQGSERSASSTSDTSLDARSDTSPSTTTESTPPNEAPHEDAKSWRLAINQNETGGQIDLWENDWQQFENDLVLPHEEYDRSHSFGPQASGACAIQVYQGEASEPRLMTARETQFHEQRQEETLSQGQYEHRTLTSASSSRQSQAFSAVRSMSPPGDIRNFRKTPRMKVAPASTDMTVEISQVLPVALSPGLHGHQATFTQQWTQAAMSDPLLFNSMMYSSSLANYRRLRQTDVGAARRYLEALWYHEAEALAWLRQTMVDTAKAFNDTTLLSIICIAFSGTEASPLTRTPPFKPPLRDLQYLNTLGSSSCRDVHMQGVVELVKLRGGIGQIAVPGLREMVSLIDVLVASRKLSAPVFPFVSILGGDLSPVWRPVVCDAATESSPFFGVFCAARLNSEIMEVFHEMHDYESMARGFMTKVPDGYSAEAVADKRNLVQYRLLSLPPAEKMASVFRKNHPNYEPCRVAMLVYSLGVIYPLAPGMAPFERLAQDLRSSLIVVGLGATNWTSCNWLLLWILTVGGIASAHLELRAWFVAGLGRVAARKGLSTWAEVKEQLVRILWLDEACDDAGLELWKECEKIRDQD
ncbi:hypothetical protein PV08_06421 [Exophiala spinifera]|uniref:Transcription factor domain-containing protein n=1 Tax=Exophiala spinifera TaxID=91928 RepID=A0A0D2BCM3_9EURO|nr:uncharacterized protein PV08_06421 [Exophiala spinifera]KIW16370.1 hypothetical protein PV08_06421 [Exophiala spinifera]